MTLEEIIEQERSSLHTLLKAQREFTKHLVIYSKALEAHSTGQRHQLIPLKNIRICSGRTINKLKNSGASPEQAIHEAFAAVNVLASRNYPGASLPMPDELRDMFKEQAREVYGG